MLSIAKRMRGNATICISYKMQPTKSLLLEEKVGGFSRSDEARNPPLPVADIGGCSANEATSFASVSVAKRLCRIVRAVGHEMAVIKTI